MTTDHATPGDLRYTASHEWLRRDAQRPDEATIGITDYAQDQLGDVVYVDLPAAGKAIVPARPAARSSRRRPWPSSTRRSPGR